jgi:hypothetical protein
MSSKGWGAGLATLVLLAAGRGHAQGSIDGSQDTIPERIRQAHMVHVSPHLIVLTPTTRSAVLDFSNTGDMPVEAEVVIQLGYTRWQNSDTALFSPTWLQERVRDTVIMHPGSKEHYAGQWLSGAPAHIKLQPHQTQRVTLRIEPPKDVPNGEYYARIVTLAHPPTRDKGSQDTRAVYALPVQGEGLPSLRDSVRVFYRQGPQSMGLRITQAETRIDSSGSVPPGYGDTPLRTLLRLHLTGTAHFEGYMSVFYLGNGGDTVNLKAIQGAAITLHTDGIMRVFSGVDLLHPGHYTLIVRFTARQDEFSPSQRLSMSPVQVSLPFDIP